MVTKLKSNAGRCLGLAFASFLVFTLLMSGAVLAQERHDAVRDPSVKDEFMAEAYLLAAELGAEFGLDAEDAVSLVATLLFTAQESEPGANMRWLLADLSATYGLEPRELIGFVQLYGAGLMAIGQDYGLVPARGTGPAFGPRVANIVRSGSDGPRGRWQVAQDQDGRLYGPRGWQTMRSEHEPVHGSGAVRPVMVHADAMRYQFQRMHEEFHMQDAGHQGGGYCGHSDTAKGNAMNRPQGMDPRMLVMMTNKHAWQGGPEAGSRYGDADAAKARWYQSRESDGIHAKRGGVEHWKEFDKDGVMPEAAGHDGDGVYRKYGKAGAAEVRGRVDKRAFADKAVWHETETPDRMRMERMRSGEHPGGRIRGGQPDFMDEDGMDVSVKLLVDDVGSDIMDLEHDAIAMVPILLDVVGSAIVESLAESTGMPETQMEAMVVQALLEGLDAAINEGLVTQGEAMDMLMLLTGAGAMEQ